MNKYSYDDGERVRAVTGFYEGQAGRVVQKADGGSHWYLVQLDNQKHTTWIHYFDLKRVTV